MLAIAARSRLPQLACRCWNFHVRAASSESTTRPPALQEILHHTATQLPSNTAAAASGEQDAALDPVVQEQIKRMLRVDHAGEFAAGNHII
jgi:demethoxyubiquinone hydroxylase (CLK1/Coq7/Cat5 family)